MLTSSPIFFNSDIPVIIPGTIFRDRGLQKFRLLQVLHYIELVQFFWQMIALEDWLSITSPWIPEVLYWMRFDGFKWRIFITVQFSGNWTLNHLRHKRKPTYFSTPAYLTFFNLNNAFTQMLSQSLKFQILCNFDQVITSFLGNYKV